MSTKKQQNQQQEEEEIKMEEDNSCKVNQEEQEDYEEGHEEDRDSNDSELDNLENKEEENSWQDAIIHQEDSYISNASDYLKWAKQQKKVKVIAEQMPWDSKVSILDVSLHRGGPMEDKKYAYFPHYRINIKRGNSVCVINQDGEDQTFFCRRGMRKFYDMSTDFLDEGKKLSGYHQKVKFLTLQKAKTLLNNGSHYIHIYNLFKENGEHCQISYLKTLQKWLIASKNVTILVSERSDAEKYYTKLRYYWSRLICDEWFNILEKLSTNQIEQLKEKMNQYTFIGEHCGNPKHQHIFQYDKVQIIFYSIVENNSPSVCLPVDAAFKIFNEFGLNAVRKKEILKIENSADLLSNIASELKKVGEGIMEEEGEGGVVYIVSEHKESHIQETLSCCKLKTTEYNIYRKLREMLKLSILKKTDAGRKNDRFKAEVESISASHLPPSPIDFYLKIGRKAFAYIDSHLKDVSFDLLRYEFLSFLKKISAETEEDEKGGSSSSLPTRLVLVTPPAKFSDQFIVRLAKQLKISQIDAQWREDAPITERPLSLLHMIPRVTQKSGETNTLFVFAGFDEEGKQSCQNSLENDVEVLKTSKFAANMFQFINSKQKKQMVELLFSKAQGLISNLKSNIPANKFAVFSSSQSDEEIFKTIEILFTNLALNISPVQSVPIQLTNPIKQRVVVVLPIGLPGSGKTFFGKLLEKQVEKMKNSKETQCTFYSISSDEIRSNLMTEYDQTRKERQLSTQELFEATSAQARIKFGTAIKELLGKIQIEGSSNSILYVDRVTPPKLLEEMLELIKSATPKELELRIAAYIVKSSHPTRFGKHNYLFSEQILLGCISNSLQRENHETLVGDAVLLTKTCLKFFAMFQNCTVNQLASYSLINLLVQLPLVIETTSTLPPSLLKKIEKSLELFPPGAHPPDSPVYTDLVQTFYSSNLEFNHPEISKLENTANNFIKAILAMK